MGFSNLQNIHSFFKIKAG